MLHLRCCNIWYVKVQFSNLFYILRIVWSGLGTNNSGFVSTNMAGKKTKQKKQKKNWCYIKNIGFTVVLHPWIGKHIFNCDLSHHHFNLLTLKLAQACEVWTWYDTYCTVVDMMQRKDPSMEVYV